MDEKSILRLVFTGVDFMAKPDAGTKALGLIREECESTRGDFNKAAYLFENYSVSTRLYNVQTDLDLSNKDGNQPVMISEITFSTDHSNAGLSVARTEDFCNRIKQVAETQGWLIEKKNDELMQAHIGGCGL